MLTPERIQELRAKAGIKPQGISGENTAQNRIAQLRQNSNFSGVPKYNVPERALTLNEKLAKAQAGADKAKLEAKTSGGFFNILGNTISGVGKTLASSEIGLGKTIAKTMEDPDSYAKNVETISKTISDTKKIIDRKEAEGKDVTGLKRFYNSQIDMLKENKGAISDYEKSLPTTGEVVGQLAGTALDIGTAGTYGSQAKGMKSFELAGKKPLVETVAKTAIPELGKVSELASKPTGLFTKKGALNVAKGAGIGYGYDVSQGLQAKEENPYAPGLGTAIGAGIPAISEGIQSVKNARTPDIKAQKLITKRQKSLDKLDNYKALKIATEKGRERGIDVKKVLSETDVLHGSVDKTGTITTKGEGGAIEQYTKQFIDGNEGIVGEALRKEGKGIAPEIVRKRLKDAVMKSGIEGKALTTALKNIDDELAGYALKGTPGGSIPLSTLHDAKVNKYNNINFFTEGNVKQYDKTIAKTLKEIVEKESKDVSVKEINKELSKHFAVIDYLNKLDNKKVAGGKLGKYFAQTVGSIVGSHFGPVGAVIGAEAGGRIKGGIMERSFQGKTGKIQPQAEVITKTRGFIDEPALGLSQSKSNSLGNLNQSQAKTITPTTKVISGTVPQSKLDVQRYISGHLAETSDVLNTLSPEEIQSLGGIETLLKSTKKNIADGLVAYQQDAIAEKIKNIDLSKLKTLFDFQDEVEKVLSHKVEAPSSNAVTALMSKMKNIPNKQGGFIRIGKGESSLPKSKVNESVSLPNNTTDLISEAKVSKQLGNGLRDGQPPVGSDWNDLTKTRINLEETVARERFDIPKLEKLSFGGSDRDVYLLPSGEVLKVAKTSRGLTQNVSSADYYAEGAGLIPNTIEQGKNYLVKEFVGKPDANTKAMIAELKKLNVVKLNGKMGGFGEHQKEVEKAIDILNKYGYSGDDLMNYQPLWGDMTAIRNWGTKEGKPILLDEGTLNGDLVLKSANTRGSGLSSDPEFRDIYNQSKSAKKKFSDLDKKTMYGVAGLVGGGTLLNDKDK